MLHWVGSFPERVKHTSLLHHNEYYAKIYLKYLAKFLIFFYHEILYFESINRKADCVSTVVVHSPRHPRVKGSIRVPAVVGTCREKIQRNERMRVEQEAH